MQQYSQQALNAKIHRFIKRKMAEHKLEDEPYFIERTQLVEENKPERRSFITSVQLGAQF